MPEKRRARAGNGSKTQNDVYRRTDERRKIDSCQQSGATNTEPSRRSATEE